VGVSPTPKVGVSVGKAGVALGEAPFDRVGVGVGIGVKNGLEVGVTVGVV